jgi:hypothetical protein
VAKRLTERESASALARRRADEALRPWTVQCSYPMPDTEAASPTAHLLDAFCTVQDEPDARPLPDPRAAQGLLNDSFDGLVAMLADTRLGVEVRCDSQASGWGGFG